MKYNTKDIFIWYTTSCKKQYKGRRTCPISILPQINPINTYLKLNEKKLRLIYV